MPLIKWQQDALVSSYMAAPWFISCGWPETRGGQGHEHGPVQRTWIITASATFGVWSQRFSLTDSLFSHL